MLSEVSAMTVSSVQKISGMQNVYCQVAPLFRL